MLGWIVDLDQPVVIVAGDDQDRDEIVRQCLDIGHDTWSASSMVASTHGGRRAGRSPESHSSLLTTWSGPSSTSACKASSTTGMYRARSTSSSARSPLADVPDGPITVMCGHGERAMSGASLLAGRGHRDVNVLDGGPDEWALRHGVWLTVE